MIREASKKSIHTLLMLGLAWWIVFYGSEMLEQSFYSNAISYSSMGSLMLGKIFVIACGLVLSTYSSYHFFGRRNRRFVSSILVSLMMILPKYESLLTDFDRINFVVESQSHLTTAAVYLDANDPSVLHIDGDVSEGMLRQISKTINVGVKEVHLRSWGGDIFEAFRVYDYLRQRNLSTVVDRSCFSACTIIFMSGRERVIGEHGKLGFHAAKVYTPAGSEILSQRSNRQIVNWFSSIGVNDEFSKKAWSVPHEKIWIPASKTLFNAGVATDTR